MNSSAQKAIVFWEWFKSNSDRIFHFENSSEIILNEISDHLAEFSSELAFEISPEFEDGREFIVSAEGIIDNFHLVVELINNAPVIPNWKLISFRQRIDVGYGANYMGFELIPEDIRIAANKNKSVVDIKVYIKDYPFPDLDIVQYTFFLLLDSLIGEYNAGMKIDKIEFAELPKEFEGVGLLKTIEFRDVFDQMFLE